MFVANMCKLLHLHTQYAAPLKETKVNHVTLYNSLHVLSIQPINISFNIHNYY